MIRPKLRRFIFILFIASIGLLFWLYAGDNNCCADEKASTQKTNDCSDPCKASDSCKDGVMDKARAKLMSSYYCSAYSACSVDRDLRGASEAELEEYKKAKGQDGKTFTGRVAPDFQAVSTNGQTVKLSQFHGKPLALVFLAIHCNHSQDTLPILTSLKKEYEPQGLSILPV
jgi:thiol-disulfide isomerase/thioredoxin